MAPSAKDVTFEVVSQNDDGTYTVRPSSNAGNPYAGGGSSPNLPAVTGGGYVAMINGRKVTFASEADAEVAGVAIGEMRGGSSGVRELNSGFNRGGGGAGGGGGGNNSGARFLRGGADAADAITGFFRGRNLRQKRDDLARALSAANTARDKLAGLNSKYADLLPSLIDCMQAESDVNAAAIGILDDQILGVDVQAGTGVARVMADMWDGMSRDGFGAGGKGFRPWPWAALVSDLGFCSRAAAGAATGPCRNQRTDWGNKMDKLDTLEGVLSGAALAAAAGFAREGDETQRRIRIAMDDSSRALRKIDELSTRGDFVRSGMPVVMDFDAGLSISNQPTAVPSVIPSSAGVVRPDLAANMPAAVADLKWPPKPGQYDERGNILAIGELTALASALTYEELRAFLQGLVQSKSPTAAQKVQIFFAANGLTTALYNLNLTGEQYVQAWKTFFASTAGGGDVGNADNPPVVDAHGLVTSPPVVTVIDVGITSVVPLGLPNIPASQYAHQNTDNASKWRVAVGANVSAGSTAFQVTFGTSPWVKNGKPYQPVVLSASPLFVVSTVTSGGFTVKTVQGIGGGTFVDVGFAVCAG